MFNCDINVEAVSSIQSVEHLYKYVYKSHDIATIVIQNTSTDSIIYYNEISHLIETSYVNPVEACYRILSKSLQSKSDYVGHNLFIY
jgi:hypothetical protein